MEYLLHIGAIAGIYLIAACGIVLLSGMTGLLSLGHAGFFAIGAYAAALLSLSQDCSLLVSIPLAASISALAGLLFSVIGKRLGGDYFALATLAFGEIVRSLLLNMDSLTNGPMGMAGIRPLRLHILPANGLFSSYQSAIVVASIATLCVIIFLILSRSKWGLILRAFREDERGAIALGYSATVHKSLAIVASAFVVGLAGALYAHYLTFIDPSLSAFSESVLFLCIAVLGGLDSVLGAVLATFVIIGTPELLRFMSLNSDLSGGLRQIFYGLVLIILMTRFQTRFWFKQLR